MAQCGGRYRHQERGGHPFPAYVTDGNPQFSTGHDQILVKVTADMPGRDITGRQSYLGYSGHLLGQQTGLDFACGLQLGLIGMDFGGMGPFDLGLGCA